MEKTSMIVSMSHEYSLSNNRIINVEKRKLFRENHSSRCLSQSCDFHEIDLLQRDDKWMNLKTRW